MNKKIFVGTVILILGFPLIASAMSFGGYYRIGFPSETYESSELETIDFEASYLGFCGEASYDINSYLAIEAAISYSKYPVGPLTLLADYPGALVPEDMQLWTARTGAQLNKNIFLFTPYIAAGVGLYNISIIESRLDNTEYHFNKSYPGLYFSGGVKTRLFGPLSFDVSPTYSYVISTSNEDDRMDNFHIFDVDFGIVIDI